MNEQTDSEVAESEISTTSRISKNPIVQNKATDPPGSVTIAPSESEVGDSTIPATTNEGGSEAVEAGTSQPPSATRGPGRPAKINPDKLILLPLDKILSHPMNKSLFGEHSSKEIDALATSLTETTQLTPLSR